MFRILNNQMILTERITVIKYLLNAIRNTRRSVDPSLNFIVEKFKQCYETSDFSTIVDENGTQIFTLDEINFFDQQHYLC